MKSEKLFLHSGWTVRAVGGELESVPANIQEQWIPATVPGCVHTDLLAADLIKDPYYDRNELDLAWIGNTDWRFVTQFDVEEHLLENDRVDLVCEGLDTVAQIRLNGHLVGNTENMHLAYRFDVKEYLQIGGNELAITFSAPNLHALSMEEQLGTRPYATTNSPIPFNFIRKMACNFGWDWGPRLTTSGIWQPIYLHIWNVGRLDAIRPLVEEAGDDVATLDVLIDVEHAEDSPLLVRVVLVSPDGREFEQQQSISKNYSDASVSIPIHNPQLWWPRGYGQQPLYELLVELLDEAGNLLEQWQSRVGLRTARLNTDADETGTQFVIEINGKAVFCKGANWIPDDCFVTRVDEARYRERIQQAVDSNMNMLRVWGGGLYETDAFYRICDELGVMVWQDFLFACAAYPEEPPFDELIEAEARYQVKRLSRYASLVLWNGNNENIWGYFDWGWQYQLDGATWGQHYYLNLLPAIVHELDPSRPYWQGSPYSGSMDVHPLDDRYGNKHIWDAWNAVDYTIYRNYTPRFVSEFGHQAPPTYATLRQSIPDDQFQHDSPAMLHHQKAMYGTGKLNDRLLEHFDMPADFDDWLYLTQVNQARALITGVEWFRSRQLVCMGTLYWQINDCWPVTSWASVDGYGRLKPLWYATRRFYADRLLTIQPEGEGLAVFAVNDCDDPWLGELQVQRMSFDGAVKAEMSRTIFVPPRTNQRILNLDAPLSLPEDAAAEYLVARFAGTRAWWFFERDKSLAYPEPAFDAAITRNGGTVHLNITARTLLRDLAVFADRVDPQAAISDQLITLLPGESYTFDIETDVELDIDELTRPPVLQCVNWFGRR